MSGYQVLGVVIVRAGDAMTGYKRIAWGILVVELLVILTVVVVTQIYRCDKIV